MTTKETAMVTRRKFMTLGTVGAAAGVLAETGIFTGVAYAADRPLTLRATS